MKKSVRDIGFITENGVLIGLSLGWDFTAEHEWGIAGIKSEFGIPDVATHRVHGVNARAVTRCSKNVRIYEDPKRGFTYLTLLSEFDGNNISPERLDTWMGIWEHLPADSVHTAWSQHDFAIRAQNADEREKLREFAAAFRRKDVLVFLGGGDGPFENAGLVIAIKSHVPKKYRESMVKIDLDALNLSEMVEKTGIKQRLQAAKLKYLALSPKFLDAEGRAKRNTKYPVMFWLNPADQRKHQYGWYTVEDLERWIDGTGPVLQMKSA